MYSTEGKAVGGGAVSVVLKDRYEVGPAGMSKPQRVGRRRYHARKQVDLGFFGLNRFRKFALGSERSL